MLYIKQIDEKDIDLCFELDSNTISLWTKNQWANGFKNESIEVFGLLFSNLLIGICVLQVVLDEAQINFFAINEKFRKRGFGSYFLRYIIKHCEKRNIIKLQLEVSQQNSIAEKFYKRFNFDTVGIRKNYYKDGSDALLKEKKINDNII